jgi:threonine aldolase
MLGGGMRQAGILAAAGIVALEKVVPRLGEDHVRARKLAEGLSGNRGLVLDEGTPATNMIFMNLSDDVQMSVYEVAEKMKEKGVLIGVAGKRRFRLVTHYWIDDEVVERAIAAFDAVLN